MRKQILDPQTQTQTPLFARNIENFIGTAKVPLAVAGPLRVRAGLFAYVRSRPGRLLLHAGPGDLHAGTRLCPAARGR